MKFPWFKRWVPVISSGVLVVTVGIRVAGTFGLLDNVAAEGAAQGLDTLSGVIGLTPDAELAAELAVLTAAVTGAGAGVVMKLRAQVNKAKGER